MVRMQADRPAKAALCTALGTITGFELARGVRAWLIGTRKK
jgi:hypothetical protein